MDNKQVRVRLRPWAEDDLALLMRLVGDPVMMEHLGGPEPIEQIRRRHTRYCQSSLADQDPMFVIELEKDQMATGSIGYWERSWQGETVWETGWSILPEFQGYGIATKATALIVERARLEQKHRFMHAFPSVKNSASNAICRKSGFELRGEVNFEYPPGNSMRCNDWVLDLFASQPNRPSA